LVVNPMWLTGGSIAVSRLRGAVSPDYRVFALDDSIEPRFLHHLLRSQPYRDQYDLFVRANTTFDRRIQQEDLDQLPLWLPERQEQRRIADFLDDRVARIDRIIVARRQQQDLLENRLLAQIRQGVAGVLDERQVTASSPIPWLEKMSCEARVAKLARVLTMQRGVDLTADEQRPGNVPVITTAGVTGWHDVAIATGPGVVIGRYGSVGSVHWVEGDYWPHNTTLYLKDAHGNSLRWAYYLLRSFPYAALQARAAVPGVNRNDMAAEDVPIIPRPLQAQVADVLDARVMDAAQGNAAVAGSIELLTEYKQSLITAAVTGDLDVTTAGSGIPG